MLSILGVESCGCLGSCNSGMIYLACQRTFRRNTRDSKPVDWEAFLTAAIPDMPHENMSSKTKEALTLTSVKLKHFLLNQKPLFSFLYISHLTHTNLPDPKDPVTLQLLSTVFPLPVKYTAEDSDR